MSDRPRDAYGALSFLRGRRNILMERVFLMGWGHGGTAALAAFNRSMAEDMSVFLGITLNFRAIAAIYPGCNSILNLSGLGKYKPAGKILMATVGKDDAADPAACRIFANRLPNKYIGGNLYFPEATNQFDAGSVAAGSKDETAAKKVLEGVTKFFAEV
jgi:carboxymethylenebutenolidase